MAKGLDWETVKTKCDDMSKRIEQDMMWIKFIRIRPFTLYHIAI